MKPSALIFDLDGTLIDSMGGYTDVFCDVLVEHHGLDREFCRNAYLSIAGMAPGAQFREVLRRSVLTEDSTEAMLEAFWQRCELETPALFPEVASVLAQLTNAGYAMFISSGGRTDVARQRVATAGIESHFRHVLGSNEDTPGMSKGSAHFGVFAGLLGVPMSELSRQTWLVGDGPYDMQVARAAGIRAIGRLTGDNGQQLRAAGAELLIRDLGELKTLLDGATREK